MESEPPISDPPKRQTRWLQFSLRSLILVNLIGGVLSGRLGRLIEEKYDKERAIEEQQKAWDESHAIAAAISRQLGVQAMACTQLQPPDYVYVEIHAGSANDETLKQLSTMPRIGSLNVYGGQFTDAGVRHLTKLMGLQYLRLRAKNVTDAGSPYLAQMLKLRRLDLRTTSVTDAGVSEIQRALPNCEIIH
jgi:hypothetical protein